MKARLRNWNKQKIEELEFSSAKLQICNTVQTFTQKKRRYCSKNNEMLNNMRIFAT